MARVKKMFSFPVRRFFASTVRVLETALVGISLYVLVTVGLVRLAPMKRGW